MTIVAAVLVILRSLIDVTADKPFHPRVTSVNKWVNERFSWLFLTKTQPDTTRSQLDQTVYISFAAIYLISYIVAILSLFV